MKKTKAKKARSREDLRFNQKVVTGWLFLVFTLYPLIVTNFYFNILKTKTLTFTILTLLMLGLVLVNGIAEEDFSPYQPPYTFGDKAFAFFVGAALISTLSAYPYIFQAFQGNEGRYNGLQLYLIYFFAYLVLRKEFVWNLKIFEAFLCSGLLVALFGITDYFNLDLLNFKEGMLEQQIPIYTSTLGNINTYTAYLALLVCLSAGLFIFVDAENEKGASPGRRKSLLYYMVMLIAFIALTMGNSDNGYLTLLSFFAFVPFFALRRKESCIKYMVTLSSYLTVIWGISLINKVFVEQVLGIQGLYNIIAGLPYLPLLVLTAWGLTVLLYWFLQVKKAPYEKAVPILLRLWSGLLLLALLVLLYVIYLVNTGPDPAAFGALQEYAIFSDAWGTYRGYIWKATVEEYGKLDILHKLFGTGPDTFGIYMEKLRYEDMLIVTGQFFDSAHNEYLQYLFTHGIVGLGAYLVFLGYTIYSGFYAALHKDMANEKRAVLLGLTYGVLAYATQAIVNINIPIASAVFFTFIMLISALAREGKEAA